MKTENRTAEEILSEVFQRETPEITHPSALFDMLLSAMEIYKNQAGYPVEIDVAGFKGKFQTNEDAEAFQSRCIYYQNKFTNSSESQTTITQLTEDFNEAIRIAKEHSNTIIKLREENRKLRRVIRRRLKAESKVNELREDNERQKSTIKELVEALRDASERMTKARNILTEIDGQPDCWQMLNASNIESILSKVKL